MSVIDAVVYLDLASPLFRVFEARLLTSFGSWIEDDGASRSWPLYVLRTAEPPARKKILEAAG